MTNLTSELVLREYNGIAIPQRPDGYISATRMCQAGGKLWGHFKCLKSTDEYIATLKSVIGIPITDLIITVQGGDPQLQGTWIHPRLASRLAQWISPEFAVIVDGWVLDIIEGRNPLPQQVPSSDRFAHIREAIAIGRELMQYNDELKPYGQRVPQHMWNTVLGLKEVVVSESDIDPLESSADPYAYLDEINDSQILSKKVVKAFNRFLEECIESTLSNDFVDMREVYAAYCTYCQNNQMPKTGENFFRGLFREFMPECSFPRRRDPDTQKMRPAYWAGFRLIDESRKYTYELGEY